MGNVRLILTILKTRIRRTNRKMDIEQIKNKCKENIERFEYFCTNLCEDDFDKIYYTGRHFVWVDILKEIELAEAKKKLKTLLEDK
jgi:hypothetical protein